jgi:exodeoxyribonuclease VII small subunit
MISPHDESRMPESDAEPLSFEQALAALEQTVRQLEDGDVGLEEALGCYERGIGLLKRCYTQLREAEQKILLLTGADADGRPATQPFEHTATAEVKKLDGAPRRKKSGDGSQIPF